MEHIIEIDETVLSKQHTNFIQEVIHTANSSGVQVQVRNQKHVICNDLSECNGYFIDTPPPVLAVACDYPLDHWFHTLVHESCHMDQWIENSPYWSKAKILGVEAISLIELWINNRIELADHQKWDIIRCARNVELDCERRAIEKIKRLNLPLNIEEYAQRANAYILYYNIIGYHRRWYGPEKSPYTMPSIVNAMPKYINDDDEWYGPFYMANDIKRTLEQCL